MKKWTKNEIKEVKNRVEYYKQKMFLSEWTISLIFKDCLWKSENSDQDETMAAETDWFPAYKKAQIIFYSPSREEWKQNGSYWLDKIIVHELAHNLTTRLTDLAKERYLSEREIDFECEYLTEYIANCIKLDYVQRPTSSRIDQRRKVLGKSKK